jgi:hypothetical protein
LEKAAPGEPEQSEAHLTSGFPTAQTVVRDVTMTLSKTKDIGATKMSETSMTFATALNKYGCSCGNDDGISWFCDQRGLEVRSVEGYTIEQNKHGVHVFGSDEIGGSIRAFDSDGKLVIAKYNGHNWTDENVLHEEHLDDEDDE